MNIKLIIATHKKYDMPQNDIYLPLQVGAHNKDSLGYQKDNEGDNISEKNYSYCELTGLYWAWKNLDCDILGLVHYRRHFKNKRFSLSKQNNILNKATIEKKYMHLLQNEVVLLPKKRHYFIENNRQQYLHAHKNEGFYATEEIIKNQYPDYFDAWNKVMNSTSGHRFNMFIAKKNIMDKYCEWLFEVLHKVELKVDISSWDAKEQRIFGYLSERLFDVWLLKNNIKVKDIPYVFMEKMHWGKKIFAFLKRKFKHE